MVQARIRVVMRRVGAVQKATSRLGLFRWIRHANAAVCSPGLSSDGGRGRSAQGAMLKSSEVAAEGVKAVGAMMGTSQQSAGYPG